MPTRLHIKGASLEGLEARVLNKFPAGARIVAAEKVTEGGIAGFWARHYFEAIVEIPDADTGTGAVPPPVLRSGPQPAPAPAGVAALLRDAEDAMRGGKAARQELPAVSTGTEEFDALLATLTGTIRQEPDHPAPDVPHVLDGPGDAVMVVGLGPDALTVARSMAAQSMAAQGKNAVLRTAGSFQAEGYEHLVSRNGLTSARAEAVIAGQTVFVAFGVGADGTVRAPALADMNADQVWLAVDATRKPSDTLSWTRRVSWASRADALAVLNSHNTLTPQSVNELSLPIGWVDDRQATRPVL